MSDPWCSICTGGLTVWGGNPLTEKTLARQRQMMVRPPVDLGAIVAGVIVTFLLTLAVSALLAVGIYLTDMTEAHVTGALYYIGLVAVAIGGAAASRRAGTRGWLHGGITGLAYVGLSLAIGTLLFPGGAAMVGVPAKLLTGTAAGAIGGVAGINL